MSAAILLYDLETSYLEGATWGRYEQNMLFVDRESHLLSFAWKWYGKRQTYVKGLPDFATYKKDKRDDRELVKLLHELFCMADYVVAHNGKRFDDKVARTRFIAHDLGPPDNFKSFDTLQIARGQFRFSSNHLDDLGEFLGVGRKLDTGGKYLWKQCINGDMKAWAKMKKYNKQDVVLLEKVYEKLRPYAPTPPPMNLMEGTINSCPYCGLGPVQKRGLTPAGKVSFKQRFKCENCKANFFGRPTIRTDTKYVS